MPEERLVAPTLLICADASPEIGMGHVMRTLALAQAWRAAHGRAVFSTAAPAPLLARLRSEGFEVAERNAPVRSAAEWLPVAAACAPDWIVLDGYAFDVDFSCALRCAGYRVLQVDDYLHQPAYEADILLNTCFGVEPERYAINPDARLLLGPRYALLRQDFAARRPPPRDFSGSPLRVLVTMGGADPGNVTLAVLRSLAGLRLPDVRISVLMGPVNPHREVVRKFLESAPLAAMWLENVSDMAKTLFEDTDFVVSSASSTCFEIAYAGLPFAAIQTADNQRLMAEALERSGAAIVLPAREPEVWAQRLRQVLGDRSRLRQMAAQTAFEDGQGARRVASEMKSRLIRLRPAAPADRDDLFAWRNHPSVRKYSRDAGEIPYAAHCRWFARALDDAARHVLVAEVGKRALGVLRFDEDRAGQTAEISIYLTPDMQGQGWGDALLLAGIDWCRAHLELRGLTAEILPGNERSATIFARAGFSGGAGGWHLRLEDA